MSLCVKANHVENVLFSSLQGCRKRTVSMPEKIGNGFLCIQPSEYFLEVPFSILQTLIYSFICMSTNCLFCVVARRRTVNRETSIWRSWEGHHSAWPFFWWPVECCVGWQRYPIISKDFPKGHQELGLKCQSCPTLSLILGREWEREMTNFSGLQKLRSSLSNH